MWPVSVNTADLTFDLDTRFTLGAMADSLYEYLPKEYLLLGGRSSQYKEMYEKAIEVAKKELFFRPRTPHGDDILLSGQVTVGVEDTHTLLAEGQHLTCFVGGMVAMAAKIFNRPDEVEIGRKLTEGCVWAYNSTATGIMPENFVTEPCINNTDCSWSPRLWYQSPEYEHLMDHELERKGRNQGMIPGFLSVWDRRYLLRYFASCPVSKYEFRSPLMPLHNRPEAIESVFILYRITGETSFQDKGWNMFTAIEKHARAEHAYGAVSDVTVPEPIALDEMESFWLGETLKYFYLLFSEPDVVSLDKYVLNTEAHPLLRPV
jgi:mannosyl-oligosaccharide alpha-1,2-mannosidase